MASNPVPLIIPCHRVVAAGGGLGGFSAEGGPGLKRRLLEHEKRFWGVSRTPLAPSNLTFATTFCKVPFRHGAGCR